MCLATNFGKLDFGRADLTFGPSLMIISLDLEGSLRPEMFYRLHPFSETDGFSFRCAI